MGAFNEWTKGSFLEQPRNRRVVTVARNILYGAAVLTRLHFLRAQSVALDVPVSPVEDAELSKEFAHLPGVSL
jgi:hypothetical protein